MAVNDDFLHGVEVVEIQDGARPIFIQRSAVIGLIGTAPDSEDAVAATYQTGVADSNNDLVWTALAAGVPGNNIGVYFEALDYDQKLSVSVSQMIIKVSVATDSLGVITSTAEEIKQAVLANADAAALVGLTYVGTQLAAARVAAGANITVATPGTTIDGLSMVQNDRILLNAQTDATENGLYVFDTDATPLVRAADMNEAAELADAVVPISGGTYAGYTYRQTLPVVNVGTDQLTFEQCGSGVVTVTYGYKYLEGGLDEAFPLNTPVLVPGRRIYAARLGLNGTLPKAIDGIFDHARTWVIIVRVAEGADDAETKSNVIGSPVAYTGIHAFLNAESVTQVAPRILIAPEWSDETEVATELDAVAQHLIAVAIIEGPNTTDLAALQYRQNFDSDRLYLIDPQVKVWDTELNAYRFEGASARAAGVFAENDLKNGWHTSPSNHAIRGLVGLKRPIDFDLSDPSTRSNLLNSGNVNTIIQKDGYRLWGNHTLASDPRWRFISVRRTADMIHEALVRSHLWAVDRNITKFYLEEITFSVQRFLDQQTRLDHIAGGHIWVDPEINTIESLASGRVYFDIEFTPYPPAERITFRSHLTNKYLADIFPDALAA